MRSTTTSLMLAALFAASSAQADISQLIRNTGLSPAEAEGMSLSEIAGAKFNRDADGNDRQPVFRPAAGNSKSSRGLGHEETRQQLISHVGLPSETAEGLSLDHIAAMKFNRSASADERQPVPTVEVERQRPAGGASDAARHQLAAAARLSREDASGLSPAELAGHVLRANAGPGDR
jgi:hypothetical protein